MRYGSEPVKFLFMGKQDGMDMVTAFIRERRLTWAAFARLVEESPQTINNWRKRGRVPGDKRYKVASKMGISVEEFMGGEAPNHTVDLKHLTDCVEILEEMLPADRYPVPPKTRAKLTVALYQSIPVVGQLPSAEVLKLVAPIKRRYGGLEWKGTPRRLSKS